MAKLYFVKVPNIAAALRYQNRPRPNTDKQETQKLSYFRSRVAVHKPISTKLNMCIEDVRVIFLDNCIVIRLLVFGLGAREILARNDRRAVFQL